MIVEKLRGDERVRASLLSQVPKIRELIQDRVSDQQCQTVALNALSKAHQEIERRSYSASHVQQIGGPFVFVASATVEKLSDVTHDRQIVQKLFTDLNLAFLHVPGDVWEAVEQRIGR